MKSRRKNFIASKKLFLILDLNFLVALDWQLGKTFSKCCISLLSYWHTCSHRNENIMKIGEGNSNSWKFENIVLILIRHIWASILIYQWVSMLGMWGKRLKFGYQIWSIKRENQDYRLVKPFIMWKKTSRKQRSHKERAAQNYS